MIEPLQSDDALLADIDSAPAESLNLWWLGQSGFLVQSRNKRFVFDPYLSDSLTQKYGKTDRPHVRMSRRVIDPSKLANLLFVTSTHAHTDHLDAETLAAMWRSGQPILIAPRAERKLVAERWPGDAAHAVVMSDGESHVLNDVTIHAVVAAHDTLARDDAGDSRYLGYVIEIDGFTIYHSGDTVYHESIVDQVKQFPIDIAILPINGKVGNMNGTDAARLAKQIGAKLVMPCHYDLFKFNTADPNALFVPECKKLGQPYYVLKLGERFTLQPPV